MLTCAEITIVEPANYRTMSDSTENSNSPASGVAESCAQAQKNPNKAVCPTCGERSLQAHWNDYLGWDEGWHFECRNEECDDYYFESRKRFDPGPIMKEQPEVTPRRR